MKKICSVLLLTAIIFVFAGCSDKGWKGFYEEDLSKYVTLVNYSGLTYTRPDTSVDDEEVDLRISLMLEAMTELVEADIEADTGMTVLFDAYCIADATSLPEYSFEGVSFQIGVNYSDGIVNQLLDCMKGMKKGETQTFDATVPADYLEQGNGEMAVKYRVTVLAVYEKHVPELTDSIAPMLVFGCNTVSELKDEIRLRIESEKQNKADDAVRNELKSKLLDGSVIKSTPYSVYNEYYNDRFSLYERLAEAYSLSLEDFLKTKLDMTTSELQDLVSETAMKDTKEALVLYSIVKLENIACTDEQLSEYASKMALRSEGIFESGEEYLTYYGINAVRNDYLWSEVLDLVLEKAISE